jgi:hypothetical protein
MGAPLKTLLAALLVLGLAACMLFNGARVVAFSEDTTNKLKWGLFVLVGLAPPKSGQSAYAFRHEDE